MTKYKYFFGSDFRSIPYLTTINNFEENIFGILKEGKIIKGQLEKANNGTLFIDNINELPLDIQNKLLRVITDKKFKRLNDTVSIKSNFRVIASSSENLKQNTIEGTFREDLFHRLNVFEINIKSLNERLSDIPLLIKYFSKKEIEYISIELEKSCYNLVIKTCTFSKKAPKKTWSNNYFMTLYSTKCGSILSLLGKDSETAINYPDFHLKFIKEMKDYENFDFDNMVSQDFSTVCKDSIEKEQEEINNILTSFNIDLFSSKFLDIHLIWNQGIAFGFFSFDNASMYNFLTIVIIIIILFIFLMLKQVD